MLIIGLAAVIVVLGFALITMTIGRSGALPTAKPERVNLLAESDNACVVCHRRTTPALSINLLVWAPPVLGPMVFALIGILGISAAWVEEPPESGLLRVFGRRLQLLYPKTQAYFYIVGMASLATVISSVLDHGRLDFANPWLWLPTSAGVFGTVTAVTLAAIDRPTRADLLTCTGAMLLLMVVEGIGTILHVRANLTAEGVVVERFLRGAPVLAPLLFANVGLLGLLVLLDPAEPAANV